MPHSRARTLYRNARRLFQWSNHVNKQLFFKLRIICTSSRFKVSEFLEASDSTHAAGCLLGAKTPRRVLVEATQAKAQLRAAACATPATRLPMPRQTKPRGWYAANESIAAAIA